MGEQTISLWTTIGRQSMILTARHPNHDEQYLAVAAGTAAPTTGNQMVAVFQYSERPWLRCFWISKGLLSKHSPPPGNQHPRFYSDCIVSLHHKEKFDGSEDQILVLIDQ